MTFVSQATATNYNPSRQQAGLIVGDLEALPFSESLKGYEGATAEETFSGFANMSFADFIRMRYLERHNLTEDSLDAMPADERKAIEKEITEEIKREFSNAKVQTADAHDLAASVVELSYLNRLSGASSEG